MLFWGGGAGERGDEDERLMREEEMFDFKYGNFPEQRAYVCCFLCVKRPTLPYFHEIEQPPHHKPKIAMVPVQGFSILLMF